MNSVVALPNVSDAKLPAAYEHAKQALAECERLDECQGWADKMAALASYARQAQDDTLLKHAMRIQGRAVQRAGDLLKEIDGRGRPQNNEGAHGISQRRAAEQVGMSEHQQLQAVRVASIPKDEFERLIESDEPPTVTALAEMGKKPRLLKVIDHTDGRDPKDFALATQALSALRRFAEASHAFDPGAVARGSSASEHKEALTHIIVLTTWLNEIQYELEATNGV